MIAVDEINVGVARWSKQHGVARGLADGCVRRGIFGAEISLDLYNPADKSLASFPANQDLAQEIWPDQSRIAVVKRAG